MQPKARRTDRIVSSRRGSLQLIQIIALIGQIVDEAAKGNAEMHPINGERLGQTGLHNSKTIHFSEDNINSNKLLYSFYTLIHYCI